MNLIKCLILLLLVYEVVSDSEHKKKKRNKKCHKNHKCCKHHKEVPHVEEVNHFSEKHDDETINPWKKENFFITVERDFANIQHLFNPKFGHPDHFNNEHDGLMVDKFLNKEEIHEEFLEKHEDTDTYRDLLKKLNKFFKTLFEKYFNHNHYKELIKNPLINNLDDDCKNSLKSLIGKCLETVENKECFKNLLELPLKDVFDEENMNHLHNLLEHHEKKENILDYLLKLPLNAVLNHKIKDYIFEKDFGNHEDILENLSKLHLTDIFEIKTLFDKKLGELPEKIDHLGEDIHSTLEHTHEDKNDLIKFLVGKDIIEDDVKADMSKNVLKMLIMKLITFKKMLIEHETPKIFEELIEQSVKDHINADEEFAVKALLIKLGEDIFMKNILKETIERSIKAHINQNKQFAVKALLTTLGEDILIKSILKETVEHSQLYKKELLPTRMEEDDKEDEVKEKLLKLLVLKHILSSQNKPEEASVQKEVTNPQNSFKGNDDFDKSKDQLQKSIIPGQANPVESYVFDTPVNPGENSCIIDIPANPVVSYIIDIPANPADSDPGLWDYYYYQFPRFIDQEPDEDICIGCNDEAENIYYNYEQ